MADHLFLVGSEEGTIYKCSKAYTSHFLDIYEVRKCYRLASKQLNLKHPFIYMLLMMQAHHMAVHAIRWNPFHSDVFASCGADWTVKIWEHSRKYDDFVFAS